MSFPLNAQLRKKFWRNQSPVVWLDREAVDRELHRVLHDMAADKSSQTGETFQFEPKRHKAAILTDCYGAPLACLTMFADLVDWGHQLADVGSGRDYLLILLDLVQAERPELQSAGQDAEVTAKLRHFLADHPERRPVEREEV